MFHSVGLLMVWLRKNWFIIGILFALIAGFLLGEHAAVLNPGGLTNRVVVLLLFLITGLTLPTDRVRQDLATPLLHVTIQLFIFGVAPAVFLTAQFFFSRTMGGQLLVGIYALAILPTTVSSCIVFTQAAGGNTVAAVFNASFANTVGIFLSPVLLSVLLSRTASGLPADQLLSTIRNLLLNMLVPIAVGQIARIPARKVIDQHRRKFVVASNVLILVVVVLAFSRVTANPDFVRYARELPWVFVYLAVAHLVLVGLVVAVTGLLRLNGPDRITAMYVAPQKTLALGAPLLTIYFGGQDVLAVALLPLIFYHPFQLLVAGLLRGLPFVRNASRDGAIS